MVSVVIPVYNEPEGLKATLDSLIAQQYPQHEYEVIVVDNGSKDHTFQVAQQYQQLYPELIIAEKEHQLQGSYAARNKGIRISKGEILCFVDADMTVAPNFLQNIVEVFETQHPDYLGCTVHLYSDKHTLAAKYNQLGGFSVKSDLEHSQFVPTCCLSVKRDLFDAVGFFDERLESGGDYEFGQRVYRAGLKQLLAGDIIMQHPARWKYTSLVGKSKRVARGIAQLYTYYPETYKKNYRKYFSLKRHLPKNPLQVYKKAKARGLSLNMAEVIILACYHIPITFKSTAEAKKAYQSLIAEQHQTAKALVK